MIGPPTRGRVLGMGADVKPRDVYGASSSSQCSKRGQGDCLKEKEDFELRLKEIEDKSLIEILQINARGGDQNVDENREDDFEEENSQKKDNDSYDD
ncbi:hypothetical protein SO802_008564 [Lithocarpus litseifolius]|uniref:Uncharacterized protein n=1 Tax=Lithocarpus litseifolius TaxID=425828 RepID=A0AAW2D9L3_9ROSI